MHRCKHIGISIHTYIRLLYGGLPPVSALAICIFLYFSISPFLTALFVLSYRKMAYSDEEDYDYSDDQFNEDDLNDEDYDLLYQLLPELRAQAENHSYDVDESLLKEYIWESNFDLSEAFQILTENHKRMYHPQPLLPLTLIPTTQCPNYNS